MAKRTLIIFDYHSFDRETQLELNKINQYLTELLYTKRHYHNGMRFMKVIAQKFDELGIRSDIYYKMSSIQNIIDTKDLSIAKTNFNRHTFDIYLECMNQRDYRNAIKMLKMYQRSNVNNVDFIKLHLASVYTKISQFDQAQILLDEVNLSQQQNPLYYTTLLELFYKRKEYEKVVELFPLIEKYEGYTNYKVYVMLGKSYLHLGKESEAMQIFDIVAKIVKNDNFYERLLDGIKTEIEAEYLKEYPSRRDNYISYQIALDEKDYALAATYLEKVIEQSPDGNYIAQNRKKLRQLKKCVKQNNN